MIAAEKGNPGSGFGGDPLSIEEAVHHDLCDSVDRILGPDDFSVDLFAVSEDHFPIDADLASGEGEDGRGFLCEEGCGDELPEAVDLEA